MPNIICTDRAILERQLDSIARQIAALDSLPAEPACEEAGESPVLTWRMRFSVSGCTQQYTYAAVRCPDNGLWYTTGPNSPKAYTWEQLATWMLLQNEVVDGLWLASEWQAIA